MADRAILNLHSKKTTFEDNSKLKVLPVRGQTNTLSKSEGKREVNFLIIVALNHNQCFVLPHFRHFNEVDLVEML